MGPAFAISTTIQLLLKTHSICEQYPLTQGCSHNSTLSAKYDQRISKIIQSRMRSMDHVWNIHMTCIVITRPNDIRWIKSCSLRLWSSYNSSRDIFVFLFFHRQKVWRDIRQRMGGVHAIDSKTELGGVESSLTFPPDIIVSLLVASHVFPCDARESETILFLIIGGQ